MTTLDIFQYVVIVSVAVVGIVGFIIAIKSDDRDN